MFWLCKLKDRLGKFLSAATALKRQVPMTAPDRVRVATLAKGSRHSCLPIPRWQQPLWSKQIADFYDRIRCTGEVDLTLKQSLILTVKSVVVQYDKPMIFVANGAHHRM